MNEPEWGDVVKDLKGRTGVPAALVNAELPESARAADRCRELNSSLVLDSFLAQLALGASPI